jgi:GNAT superfamily N-acetyltransferase
MPPIEIRDARPADADALAPLLAELGYPTSPDVIAKRLDALSAISETVLVAADGTDLLGVITVHVTPVLHRPTYVGRITTLVVAERAHGRGVGRALVEAAERLLAKRGCALLEVTSNSKRTDAHAFYEHLGYEKTSVRFWKALSASR